MNRRTEKHEKPSRIPYNSIYPLDPSVDTPQNYEIDSGAREGHFPQNGVFGYSREEWREVVRRTVARDVGVPLKYAEGLESYRILAPQHEKLLASAKHWISAFDRGKRGLALIGPTGCGKTHLASVIALEIALRGYSVVFVDSLALMREFRDAYDAGDREDDIIDFYASPDLLVIDDLGVELRRDKSHDWQLERLYEVINGRYVNEKTLIITANKTPAQLFAAESHDLAARIASRIVEMVMPIGAFPSKDFRASKELSKS